jgi:Flp pilus assembly protein TadD
LAAKFFSKAIEQDPREAKTHYLLAEAYCNARNFDDADIALARALQLKPAQPEFIALKEKIERGRSELSR